MNSLHKNIEFELIEIENEGICVRYSPLDHANIYGTNEQDLVFLSKSLEDIMVILILLIPDYKLSLELYDFSLYKDNT